MLDFNKRDLYGREKARMENFLSKKLVTASESDELEYNAEEEASSDIDGMESGSFLEGDSFDLGSEDGEDDLLSGGDVPSFGDAGDRSGVKGDMEWQKDNPLLTFAMSPVYLFKYIFTDIITDFPRVSEWKGILKVLNTINIMGILVAITALLIGLKTIFTPQTQIIVGSILFILTTIIIKFGYKEDTRTIIIFKKILGMDKVESDDTEFDFDFGGDEEGDELDDSFGSLDLDESTGVIDLDSEDTEVQTDVESSGDGIGGLPDSPITTGSDEEFDRTVLEVFNERSKFLGKDIRSRLDLIHSFSPYLIQNDRDFGKWVRPAERNTEYNNIAYALFKGFSRIDTKFARYTPDMEDGELDKMKVLDIRKSPILYRIELELPNYISERKLQSNIKVMEDMLKASEDDENVSVIISTFQGNIVIKLLRLDADGMISFGDIVRFHDEEKGYETLEAMDNLSYGLPILFGLKNNEFPFIVDWEANTSGMIIGGSGSGKSWATFEMMLNFAVTNDYNNVNFVILDSKNSSFWKTFAKLPHVLGYHSDPMEYVNILREVEDERARRQELFSSQGIENLKGHRKKLREQGNYEELDKFPLLFLIFEEITATMSRIADEDKEAMETVQALITQIASQGRSAGVRILSIGQRSTYDSVPKTLMASTSFKFGMKMEVDADFEKLLGEDVKHYKKPNTLGMGLAKTEGTTSLETIKTLTIGGKNDDQMGKLIRVLAFDWLRRSHGHIDLEKQPEGMNFNNAFNRPKFYHESLKDMKEGRILSPVRVNEGYEVDLTSDDPYGAGQVTQVEEVEEAEETVADEKEEGFSGVDVLSGMGNLSNEPEEKEVEPKEVEPKENNIEVEQVSKDPEKEKTTALKDDITWEDLQKQLMEDEEDGEEYTESYNRVEKESELETEEINKQEEVESDESNGSEIEKGTETIESKEMGEVEREEKIEGLSLEDIIRQNKSEGNKQEKGSEEKGINEGHQSEDEGKESDNGSEVSRNTGEVVKNTGENAENEENMYGQEESVSQQDIINKQKKEIEELRKLKKELTNENAMSEEDDIEMEKVSQEATETELPLVEREREVSKKSNLGVETEKQEEIDESKKVEEVEKEEKEVETIEEVETPESKEREEVEDDAEGSNEMELGFDSTASQIVEPKMSVKSYVTENGDPQGFNIYIKKEDLERVYTEQKIEESLDRMMIIESDGYYIARM